MPKMRSIIYLAILGTAGLIVVLLNPVYMYAALSVFAFLVILQQMNVYRMVAAMMKHYAKNVSRLRLEIRAKLHMGFRGSEESIDSEESHNRTCGFTR